MTPNEVYGNTVIRIIIKSLEGVAGNRAPITQTHVDNVDKKKKLWGH